MRFDSEIQLFLVEVLLGICLHWGNTPKFFVVLLMLGRVGWLKGSQPPGTEHVS